VTTGPGHALVLIYIGGNNLAKYLFAGDAVAERGYMTDLPDIKANWEAIFGFFQDKTKFPDGSTVLMNNQYNPFDDCTAAPYFLSAKKNMLLDAFNKELATIASAKGAVLTDQHTPFLGHGHHYSVRTCPHYKDNQTPWMDDLIHPNAAGHENLFQQWKATVDRLYR
jgi:lysophospholipase L1-like esterase